MNAIEHSPGMNALGHSNHSHCEARMRVWHSAGYEARMGFRINGIHAVWHEPGHSPPLKVPYPPDKGGSRGVGGLRGFKERKLPLFASKSPIFTHFA